MSAHSQLDTPTKWVCRWAALIAPGGRVLDVACGGGRHARWLAARGYPVEAVDRDPDALAALAGAPGITVRRADLESDAWPYAGQTFAGIVVVNYLYRPLFPHLIAALASGGVLIYQTFAEGNERYGRPSRPEFLLKHGELLDAFRAPLHIVAYEDVFEAQPKPAQVQRICAVRPAIPS